MSKLFQLLENQGNVSRAMMAWARVWSDRPIISLLVVAMGNGGCSEVSIKECDYHDLAVLFLNRRKIIDQDKFDSFNEFVGTGIEKVEPQTDRLTTCHFDDYFYIKVTPESHLTRISIPGGKHRDDRATTALDIVFSHFQYLF